MTKSEAKPDRLLKAAEVRALLGIAESTLFAFIQQGRFPRPVKLGSASRWPESTVHDWIERKKFEALN